MADPRINTQNHPSDLLAPVDLRLQHLTFLDRVDELEALLSGDERARECIDGKDRNGNTALHLAITLQNARALRVLLRFQNRKSLKLKNRTGWMALHEAVATDNDEVLMLVYRSMMENTSEHWKTKMDIAIESLEAQPDCYLEVQWDFSSWIPFVGRFCPEDTYKIWKRGSDIRVDTSLVGFENYRWQTGQLSFIFKEAVLYIVSWEHKSYMRITPEVQMQKLKSHLGKPELVGLRRDVDQLFLQPTMRTDTKLDDVEFKPKLDWAWREKLEDVGPFSCKVFEMKGLEVEYFMRNAMREEVDVKANLGDESEMYFDDKEGIWIDPKEPPPEEGEHERRQRLLMMAESSPRKAGGAAGEYVVATLEGQERVTASGETVSGDAQASGSDSGSDEEFFDADDLGAALEDSRAADVAAESAARVGGAKAKTVGLAESFADDPDGGGGEQRAAAEASSEAAPLTDKEEFEAAKHEMKAEMEKFQAEQKEGGGEDDGMKSFDEIEDVVEPNATVLEGHEELTFAEYFGTVPEGGGAATTARFTPAPKVKRMSQKFKSNLWLSEDFELTMEQLMPLLQVLAPSSKQFETMRTFMDLQFPDAGFPVQIEIPFYHVVTAKVTFANYRTHDQDGSAVLPEGTAGSADGAPADWFDVPADFTEDLKHKLPILQKINAELGTSNQ